MTSRPSAVREILGYQRARSLPGIEVVSAVDSPREWRVATPTFSVVIFRTWRGPVRVRGRTYPAQPGLAFCNMPGEAMVARPEGDLPGSFNVVEIAAEVMTDWLRERGMHGSRPEWAEVMKRLSPEISSRFRHFFASFDLDDSAMRLQSEAVELSESVVGGLLASAGERRPAEGPALRGTARMRECLMADDFDMDLETLAQVAGLSRFQALRSFKRRYGLPPHAYQLCVRLGKARTLLSEGVVPVDVALRCGFVDQSHFNRHFKRAFGVTPAQYAGRHNRGRSGMYQVNRSRRDPVTEITSRPDHRSR